MTVTRLSVSSSATRTASPATPPHRCQHVPACPSWDAPDHAAARVVAAHPEQGWSLLCNGVITFSDTGEILPSRATVAPHRPAAQRPPVRRPAYAA
jgi:hypothetical protein